jgi:pilus assembly protein Flp/PilA
MFELFKKHCRAFHADESAATATEYIILLILVACFIIAIVKVYGLTVSEKYDTASDAVRKEVTY